MRDVLATKVLTELLTNVDLPSLEGFLAVHCGFDDEEIKIWIYEAKLATKCEIRDKYYFQKSS